MNTRPRDLFEQAANSPGGLVLHSPNLVLLRTLRWKLYTIRRAERQLDRKVYRKGVGTSRYDDYMVTINRGPKGWKLRIFHEQDLFSDPTLSIEVADVGSDMF